MNISRKAILTGAANTYASVAVLHFPAGAAEFNYKWGHIFPLTHPAAARAQEACDKLTQESGGRLEIKLFPNFQLGTEASLVTQLRAGAIEFVTTGNSNMGTVVPAAGITYIPFAFSGFKQAWNAVDGALGVSLRNAIRKQSFYVFEKEWDTGFKQVFNQVRPILKLDDCKGMKIIVSPNPYSTAIFKAIGSSPTPLSGGEYYTALQTHLADGNEATLDSHLNFKWYEVTKYGTITNHTWAGLLNLANVDAMQRLPKNIRDMVERRVNEFAIVERNDVMRGAETAITALKGHGIAFNQPDNIQEFKAALRTAGLYSQWRDQFGSDVWTVLEKAVGKLT